MTAPTVRVTVHEDTETLTTTVSRDADDEYYDLPEALVLRHELACAELEAASAAISKYIADNNLEPYVEDWHDQDGD